MKARRQGAILELIDREPLHSQEQLRRRLLKAGFEATPATISRYIQELGLVTRPGAAARARHRSRAAARSGRHHRRRRHHPGHHQGRTARRRTRQADRTAGRRLVTTSSPRIVLAYSGSFEASLAIRWLKEQHAAEV